MTRFALLLTVALAASAQDFKTLEQKVTEFTLANGFRFLVIERHETPVISFVTHVEAGTANDPPGQTGLASLFERLVFKGTESIGTRDAAAEKKALDAIEDVYNRLDAEKAKGRRANDLEMVRLEVELQKALNQAHMYAAPLEYRAAYDENAASAVAVRTTADSSQLRISLPSNRAELWFLMESQRLSRPVFRDFYRERDDAIASRNRESELPANRLLTALASLAFSQHPYRNPARGWPAELAQLRHSDARQFFQRYYVPGNTTLAVAGDIRPEEARRLADKYFSPIPARPLPTPARTQEPPQPGPRTAVIENSAEPLLAIGFKRPDQFDRDNTVLHVLRELLAGGHSALLAKELLETQRLATSVTVAALFPGGRYSNLFTIMVTPSAGHTAEENETAVTAVLTKLQNGLVEEEVLAGARAQYRTKLARAFSDNTSIAASLAETAAEYGDWREIFASAGAASKVTAAQVQAAAIKYFAPSRRSTVWMVPPPPVRAVAPRKGAE